MSKKDEQIARMQGLMTYGIGGTAKKTPVTESVEGPDNKVYAVIREGSKYYIKSAPKGSELVTESFDYIGGFMNKKNNEFSSYNQASKNLELKVRSLNESYGLNKPVELLNPEKKESLMVEMTDSMKNSIARYREIMNNASMIMNESAAISPNNTGNPEAPKTSNFSATIGAPFNQKAEAKLDSDLKATANNPEAQSAPFGNNTKSEDYKDAQYVPSGSVANQKPSGGKVVRVNENEEFEETIEECDEWGSCGLPSTPGVGKPGKQKPFSTLDESSDEYVGFADDSIEEDEDEDFDLDDMDVDLEEPAEYEIELDDIDTDDDDIEDEDDIDLDDDVEDDDDDIDLDDEIESSDETSEIENLRDEVEELRNIIDSLVSEDDDSELEFELSYDTDDMDDTEDIDDVDDMGDMDDDIDDIDDDIDDDVDNENMFEAVTIDGTEFDVPFDLDLQNPKSKDMRPFYDRHDDEVWTNLHHLLRKKQREQDIPTREKVRLIKAVGCCRTIYECLKFAVSGRKNNFEDDGTWDTISNMLDNKYAALNSLLSSITVFTEEEQELIEKYLDNLNIRIEYFYNVYYSIVSPVDDEIDDDIDYDEDDEESYDNIMDSVHPRRLHENSSRLHVFGKHPGYRKKPMTLPRTDTSTPYEDWNDKSVYSEEPFGSKIGNSAPYDKIVNAVMEAFKKKI